MESNSNLPLKCSVSVVIPTFNTGKYIKEAVESVLLQTVSPLEIIIVDDGSTDGEEKILGEYIREGKIKYLFQKNKGPGAARNLGINNASGDFIAFLDADDIWLPSKLEKEMERFKDDRVALVYSDAEVFGDEIPTRKYSEMCSGFFRGEVLSRLVRQNFIMTSSVVLRKNLFDREHWFSEAPGLSTLVEDYLLWIRVAKKNRIDFVREELVRYRVHAGQTSRKKRETYKALRSLYATLICSGDYNTIVPILAVKYLENAIKYGISSFAPHENLIHS